SNTINISKSTPDTHRTPSNLQSEKEENQRRKLWIISWHPHDLIAEVKESPPLSPPHSVLSHSVPPSSQQPSANPADNLSKFLEATSILREAFEKMGDVISHVDRLEEIIKFALHKIHELEKKMKTDEDPAQPV
ncbi:hypothetical protein U1Q18_036188, partial [Sarracenia purpurea var. burkii]